jgi:hypothetical protein
VSGYSIHLIFSVFGASSFMERVEISPVAVLEAMMKELRLPGPEYIHDVPHGTASRLKWCSSHPSSL